MDKSDKIIIEEIVKVFKDIGADIEKDEFVEFIEKQEEIMEDK